VRIVQQVRGQIDIRSFLFCAQDRFVPASVGAWESHGMSEELTEDDVEAGERTERPQVRVLPCGLVGFPWTSLDSRRD
jgi:hypothetical protein